MHIFRHLFVCFQTSVYTLGEFHKNRNNSTVFEGLSVRVASKTTFATVQSTTDTSNPSNTVLLFLKWHTIKHFVFFIKELTLLFSKRSLVMSTFVYITIKILNENICLYHRTENVIYTNTSILSSIYQQ